MHQYQNIHKFNTHTNFQTTIRKRRRGKGLWYKIFFSLILLCLIFLFYSGILKVENVNIVENNEYIQNSDIDNHLKNQYWFLVDRKKIDTLFSKFAKEYKIITFKKDYLNKTLTIYVDKRIPKVIINASNGTFLVDEDNIILNQNEVNLSYNKNRLPTIVYESELDLQKGVVSDILKSAIYYSESGIKNIKINDNDITTNIDDILIYLSKVHDTKEAELKVNLLKKIIQQYTIKDKKIESIDMRFSDPLIKYKM